MNNENKKSNSPLRTSRLNRASFECFYCSYGSSVDWKIPGVMITAHDEETLIENLKSLSEMELTVVFEGIADHIYRSNFGEAVKNALDVGDLQAEVFELGQEIEYQREAKYEYKSKCENAIESLDGLRNALKNLKLVELEKSVKSIMDDLSEE